MESGNYKNDLQAAQDTEMDVENNAPFMTGSVSTDINSERQNPDRRLLNTLLNVVSNQSGRPTQRTHQPDQRCLPMLSYRIHGHASPIDHYEDHTYFTAAFPTLFPLGVGGHLDDRPFALSLASYAEWALKHHSRRYIRLKVSMIATD